MPKPTPLQEISKLQEQLSKLKDAAVVELNARVSQIRTELKDIDAQLESLTGKPATRKGRATPAMRSITMQDLKDLLSSSPSQTVNIRRAGLDTTNIRTLANLHPKEIQLGGKGAWPTVGLLK
jgi:chromosome segregation ATPase